MAVSRRTSLTSAIFRFRMISSLQNPAYRLFFLGSIGQIAAMSMQIVTNPLLVYRLTGSSALLGIMSLVGAVPTIIIGLFGGAIADRIQKKFILVACFICVALISLGTAFALDIGALSKNVPGSWWIMMLANFMQGCVMGLMMPALMAIIPETVKKEQLMNAVALNNLTMSGLNLLTPSLAGLMIDNVGFEAIYYAMTALFVFATICFCFLPRTKRIASQGGQIISNIKNGLNYIRSTSIILMILLFSLMLIMLSMPFQQLLPIYVDDILKVGATGMGLLLSLSGAGALAGSLAIAALPDKKRGLALIISGIVTGLTMVIFAFSSLWWLSLTVMVFMGGASALRATVSNTLLQSYTSGEYMGRVMSLTHVQFGFSAVCTFLAGMLAEVIHVQWVVGGMAAVLIAVSVYTLVLRPKLRMLD